MEENNNYITGEYKELKNCLLHHIWLFILITVLNFILFKNIYFLYIIYKVSYLICSIIFIILIIIPIYSLFLLLKQNKLFLHQAKLWKKLTIIIIFFIILFGGVMNIIIFLNMNSLFTFYKECPYNFSYQDIADIFGIDYNEEKYINKTYTYSQKCEDNRCLLIHENLEKVKPFGYLCNFDSEYDFESFKDKISEKFFSVKGNNNEIKCKIFNVSDFNNDYIFQQKSDEDFYIIKSYYDICSYENVFYKCTRHEKPKEFKIDYDFKCPNFFNNIIILIFGFISIIFNFLFPIVLFSYEVFKYKKIYELLQNIKDDKISTKDSSKSSSQIKISNNDNNNNNLNSGTIIVGGNINIVQNENYNNNLIIVKKIKKNIIREFKNNINSERTDINKGNISERKTRNDITDNIGNKNNYNDDSIQFNNINIDPLNNIQINKNKNFLTETNTNDNKNNILKLK